MPDQWLEVGLSLGRVLGQIRGGPAGCLTEATKRGPNASSPPCEGWGGGGGTKQAGMLEDSYLI